MNNDNQRPSKPSKRRRRFFQFEVSEAWLTELDDWRRQQPVIPSRAEAIRTLVAAGIEISRERDTK